MTGTTDPGSESQLPLAAVILAAGQSQRMVGQNKLLQLVQGKTLVRHAVDAAFGAALQPVIVVTGHDAERIEQALQGSAVVLMHNSKYVDGLASSLHRGIDALQAHPAVTGACILLADMPMIRAGHLQQLRARFNRLAGRRIIVPTHQGQWGNPLIWSRDFFSLLLTLTGDRGARALAQAHADDVYTVEMADGAVLRDFDTPESFSSLPP
jgi:molybdenum cofactor cytidylyltransferase